MSFLTQDGIGTLRMCPPLPTRSTITQCSSRRCMWPTVRAATSERRSPQPSNSPIMAASLLPRSVSRGMALISSLPSRVVSQFPALMPRRFTPLTRRTPAARSGLRKPLSAASYASLGIAARRTLIVAGANGMDSRCCRYRNTTARLNASLGSEQYHAMNSSIACRYPRWDSFEGRLLSDC